MKRNWLTKTDDITELHKRLVQTCVDFINERRLKDIETVSFIADDLQKSADEGTWSVATDSHLKVGGVKKRHVVMKSAECDVPESYTIGVSY